MSEASEANRKKFGEKQKKYGTKLYWVWRGILKRCGVVKGATDIQLKNYRDKGIRVCDEWASSYEAFHAWAEANGYEEGLTIDRMDNDGDYTPGNCRWVSQRRNARNVGHIVPVKCIDIEHDAIAYFPSLADASDITGVPKENIIGCLRGHQNTAYGFKFEEWDITRYKRTCKNMHPNPDDGFVCSECSALVRDNSVGKSNVDDDGVRWYSTSTMHNFNRCPNCGAEVTDAD